MEDIEARLKHWHSLTPDEKNAIRDPNDYPILSVIGGLSPDERKKIYRLIRFPNIEHYNQMQKPWISDFILYLDENLRRSGKDHSPEIIKEFLLDEMIDGALHERFRLYYAAKYRTFIEPPTDTTLTEFLSEVDTAIKFASSGLIL